MREHYLAVEQSTGRPVPELEVPDVPAGLEHVLLWFRDLSAGRGGGGFGLNPISWTELDAWMRLTGNRPTPFELQCLRALDASFMKAINDRSESQQQHRQGAR